MLSILDMKSRYEGRNGGKGRPESMGPSPHGAPLLSGPSKDLDRSLTSEYENLWGLNYETKEAIVLYYRYTGSYSPCLVSNDTIGEMKFRVPTR